MILDAGLWKPILAVADSFPVAAPVATATPGYIAELNEIKSWQRNITGQQKQIIKYWSAGFRVALERNIERTGCKT